MSGAILNLVKPNVKYKDSFFAALAEMKTNAEKDVLVHLGSLKRLKFPDENFKAYVDELLLRETVAPPNFVTETNFWGVVENEVAGRISVRHYLNDFLQKTGGHIGYVVRPSFRGKGVASEMLRQILLTSKAKEIGKLLLTCDESNTASEKTILKNGGVLENIIDGKKRFWISV